MPQLKVLRTLAAAIESTIGTPESLGASEGAYNAYDILIQCDNEKEARVAPGQMGTLKGVPGALGGTATFKLDVAWTGTGLPAWADTFLAACGYVASSQVLTPRSEAPGSNVKTLTIGAYQDGVFKSIAGAAGTFKIVAPAGKIVTFEFEFKGVWQAVSDQALISPTYPTDLPVRYANAVTTYNSIAQCVENLTFDAGNEVILRECPDTLGGYKSGLIVDRRPKFTINPEAQLVATEDRYGDWIAGEEYPLSCEFDGPAGGTSNAKMTIAAPKAQIASIQEGERNKLVIDELEIDCNKNGANKDEDCSITFTDLVA